jgi:hypothetical protein
MLFSGKAKGHIMTLLELLKGHSNEIRVGFNLLLNSEKDTFFTNYLQAKEEKENAPKRLSNIIVSKAVDMKMQTVTAIVGLFYCLVITLTLC